MGPHLTLQAWSEESPAETGDHHPQYPGAAAADWECAAHRGNNVCHISVIICAVHKDAILHIGELKSCLHNNVTIVYLQEVDRGVEPLAVDHCAVPDSGEALGGAQHQGVLHPHTGKHLQYRV